MSEQPGGVVRVMVVEDDRETLDRFAAALSADPRTSLAQTARTGREALARLPAVRPDVLLVDLGLPDIHGTEVIRFASSRMPECDVMVITVFGDERNVFASIEAGAAGYVLKDCDDAELVGHVLSVRAGGAPVSPGIARLVLNRLRSEGGSESAGANTAVLTQRETEVLNLMSRGYSYAEIGAQLGISLHTVSSHIKNSYRKLAVRSGPAAVARATELGLLQPPGAADPKS
jgi:DNA-binding NarL/FixJ family response regulator